VGTTNPAGVSLDHWLKGARSLVADLPQVAADWEQMDEVERASWSLDWDQVIASDLLVLEQAFHANQMNVKQQKQYAALLAILADFMPLISRLSLSPPPSAIIRPTAS